MTLSQDKLVEIRAIIKDCLRKKLANYKPETSSMPFHYRLLGKDRMALFSFVQSLNTTFGTSIFEPVAKVIAKINYPIVEKQFIVGDKIRENAQSEIQHIIDHLSSGVSSPDKIKETELIRQACKAGAINSLKLVKVDLFLQDNIGVKYLFDLKTAKPNASNFKDFKRTLLEWVAILLTTNQSEKVKSLIAIPYNPYEPEPYERWTLRGMLDLKEELLVGNEFWDFLGGTGTYEMLLSCFEAVGLEMRPEFDNYFARFSK